jgi:putative component of membrane protein insertase Oxa1/YidC/SpoIIIJ protein YidD
MGVLQRWVIARIDAYQARGGGRVVFGVDCNFNPTCSAYTREAVARYGAGAGLRLGWQRIRRCTDPDCTAPRDDPVPADLPPPWWRPRERRR